ncbi:MAG: AEC family transporter [Burkholderiales bacterium]|jgi:predicted permease|nr:AEC family transporter [Burkholderiales bacterium]
MLANAALILPDFALIALGFVLFHRFGYERGFWVALERLVYYVLFPALLFNAIVATRYTFAADGGLLLVAVASLLSAAALGFLAAPVLRPPAALLASGAQTSYRYNSYLGLALAQSLAGGPGVAQIALVFAVCIPLANLIAVSTMAQHSRAGLARELLRNPLIISTVGGLAGNALGLQLPQFAAQALGRLGQASLALGLICVGAGLSLAGAATHRALLGWFSAVKLLLFPAVALALALAVGLPAEQATIALLFAALPTATSAYVLATRMGFDGAPVSFLITAQTAASMLTLPIWMAVASGLFA